MLGLEQLFQAMDILPITYIWDDISGIIFQATRVHFRFEISTITTAHYIQYISVIFF